MDEVRVGIITRLSTQNAGNEALSSELIRLTVEKLPNARVMAVDRYPRYFEHLKLGSLLKRGGALLRNFDELAGRLSDELTSEDVELPEKAHSHAVKLDTSGKELSMKLRKLKRLIGVRRNLARFGLIERQDAIRTVSMCGRVDLLIWNPAGEFHPTGSREQVFRLLLLLRIAQQRKVPTAIVNHSLELGDEALKEIVGHVYRHAAHVSVRDAQSAVVARTLGVENSRLSEAPDLVFRAGNAVLDDDITPADIPRGAIGLAINGLETRRGIDEWESLVRYLRRVRKPIIFVSNAMNHDYAFGAWLMSRCDGIISMRQPNYIELREMYRKMDLLISSRLHASILALCADTPVLTLEPSLFKLSAILQQLKYPIPTDDMNRSGWSERLAQGIDSALRNRQELVAVGRTALARQISRIDSSYEHICGLATHKADAGLTFQIPV